MRYWGILAGKLAAGAAFLFAVWHLLASSYVIPESVSRFGHSPFAHDLVWTTLMLLYNLLFSGVLFLIVLDQRYRCRTCGRRLRMPVRTARYAQILLFGTPKTEYICPYGHGTLRVPELHITGKEPSSWQAHEDIWKELYELEQKKD